MAHHQVQKKFMCFLDKQPRKGRLGLCGRAAHRPTVGLGLVRVPQDKRTKTLGNSVGERELGSHAWCFLPPGGTPTRITCVPSRIPDVCLVFGEELAHASQLLSMTGSPPGKQIFALLLLVCLLAKDSPPLGASCAPAVLSPGSVSCLLPNIYATW